MFLSLGNRESKAGDTTLPPLEGLESKRWTIGNISKDMKKLEPSYTPGENIKLCSHFGKHSGSSLKS